MSQGRAGATRRSILRAAERLFAERGVFSVSNRQISEAAGQGNTAAVGYHFGSKEDLVRAIVREHSGPTERLRAQLLARYDGSTVLRDRVVCLVVPYTRHLASLGETSWYGRFAAQLMTEPSLRELAAAEVAEAPMLLAVTEALHGCLPGLTAAVRRERDDMAHTLIVHVSARHEHSVNPSWPTVEQGLIDAIEGLYRAPASLPEVNQLV
ncbi:helix-turn-helix domain-containing protein [Actinoplanes sp. NPDC049596]|uniref:TetR/AcrR family transcriptional regulator n=1 Tax=unclassified Actinoplanes TaxID=2626549 RepID=UPI00342EE5A6